MSATTEQKSYASNPEAVIKDIFAVAGIETAGATFRTKEYRGGSVLFVTLPTSENIKTIDRWWAAHKALKTVLEESQTGKGNYPDIHKHLAIHIQCGEHHSPEGLAGRRFNSGLLKPAA